MSWIDDECRKEEERAKREVERAIELKREKGERQAETELYHRKILVHKNHIERVVDEANDELRRVGIRATVSDEGTFLQICGNPKNSRSFWFSMSKSDTSKSCYYVTLHFFDSDNKIFDTTRYEVKIKRTRLYRARINRLSKSDIITMIGLITGRIGPAPLKQLFPDLKPVPIVAYVIMGVVVLLAL